MMTNKYPDIWKVAQYIEGMVNGVGKVIAHYKFCERKLSGVV